MRNANRTKFYLLLILLQIAVLAASAQICNNVDKAVVEEQP